MCQSVNDQYGNKPRPVVTIGMIHHSGKPSLVNGAATSDSSIGP